MKGKLITLEGIDGTGKSSIAEKLRTVFPEVVFTVEPTHSLIGKAIRESTDSGTDPMAELFLFVADHAEHIAKIIKPAIEKGKVVISDRYSDSRYAYQGATLSERFDDALAWIQEIHKGWTIVPDLTILFTIDPAVAVSRCGVRGKQSKFENIEFLRTVQKNFQRLAENEPERFVVVDASSGIEEVEKKVISIIRDFLAR